jgi:hypothetical protein
MIVCSLGPDAPFCRALTPSWAYRPESGAGAALVGGRFNPPNVESRYFAATPEAALAEYQGESSLLPAGDCRDLSGDHRGGGGFHRWV